MSEDKKPTRYDYVKLLLIYSLVLAAMVCIFVYNYTQITTPKTRDYYIHQSLEFCFRNMDRNPFIKPDANEMKQCEETVRGAYHEEP